MKAQFTQIIPREDDAPPVDLNNHWVSFFDDTGRRLFDISVVRTSYQGETSGYTVNLNSSDTVLIWPVASNSINLSFLDRKTQKYDQP